MQMLWDCTVNVPSIKSGSMVLIITCFVLGIWYGQRKYAPAMLIETGNYMLKNESGFEYRKEMRYLVGGAGEYEVWTGSAGQMRQLPE